MVRGDRSKGRHSSELLAHLPLFSGLPKRALRRIRGAMEEYAFDRGQPLVQEGKSGETFFVLVEGQVRVIRRGRTVARLLPGDFFGEMSVLDGGPRTATVQAETPVRCLTLLRSEFVRILETEPGVAVRILMELTRRLRRRERPLTG